MNALLIVAAIVIVVVGVWFFIFIRVADVPTPKAGKVGPEKPWPAPPAPGLCPTCGKDMARLEATDSLRDLTFNGRQIYSLTLYSDLSGEFTLREKVDAADSVSRELDWNLNA